MDLLSYVLDKVGAVLTVKRVAAARPDTGAKPDQEFAADPLRRLRGVRNSHWENWENRGNAKRKRCSERRTG